MFAGFDTLVVTAAVMFWKTGGFNVHAILSLALGIVGMELVTKTALYAFHERMWERQKAVVKLAPIKSHLYYGEAMD